ncbi:MFS transporter [Acetobacter sp.]|jgi:GPH family glycoside/pentoside/hexuronide:cation symporter|uniref:MFS transporter n=1 Tax=Acetobacter sp. TaxID=440 RepID=UPI0025C60061|nr:glycoside-pentoside-hexuronide (GPH):cation symporter [Acetobacter sp.]MCH4090770.1 glycoside-pentoside-hexuronide (GPH):cation symporter [Acetobacter sp.]MCI1300514.1 glycoside-pentoside-hexuronide (GPH):cation symporter [Acetobacter sp.]MCI1316284.1 glycoside-pentoside-hexuronide (GPH):cation symporter [Acetobacter sp.]
MRSAEIGARRQEAAPERIGWLENIAYGSGDLSSNLMWGMSSSYLMYYYTDLVGLLPAELSILLLVARVFDALADPLVGYFIDITRGRFVLSMMKIFAIPFGIFSFLCFVPAPGGHTAQLAWAYVTYIAFGLVYSAVNTPYGAAGNMIAVTIQNRVRLNSFRMMGCNIGQFAISALTLPLVGMLATSDSLPGRRMGFSFYMAGLSISGALLWIFTARVCRLRQQLPAETHTIMTLLKSLARNRLWHICNIMVFLKFISFSSYSAFALYFARIVLGRDAQFGGVILTVAMFMSFAGAIFTPAFSARFTQRGTFLLMLAIQVVAFSVAAISSASIPAFMIAFAVGTFAFGIADPLYYTTLASAIDYGVSTTGIRAAGLAYSLNSLVTKVSQGLAGFMLAEFLVWGHYTTDHRLTDASLSSWITMGFIGLPVIAALFGFGMIWLFPRDSYLHQITEPVDLAHSAPPVQ